MCFHCNSFRVTQSIIISIILSDSRLKLSRVIPLSSVASSCQPQLLPSSPAMAAAQQSSAPAAVNEAAASIAKSIQCMTVAHVKELDIDRSFTVVDTWVNPWELKDSNSMEVDESSFKRGKKSSSSSSGSAVLTINSGRLTFG